jgi:hypothetical protein
VLLSDIARLMRKDLTPEAFLLGAAEDLAERRRLVTTPRRGSVVPVRVTEDIDVELSLQDVESLCAFFASGRLGTVDLAYVADALQLSERVIPTDVAVNDYIAEFTDPEINGVFTPVRAEEIISEIQRHT